MRTILAVLLLSVYVSTSPVANDFRNATWGMSMAQVKAAENRQPLSEEPNRLTYMTSFLGQDAIAIYYFDAGKLVRGRYVNVERHASNHAYLSYYDALTSTLRDTYGVPIEKSAYYASKSIRDNPLKWDTALAREKLAKHMAWNTLDTRVVATVAGKNNTPYCYVEYSCAKSHPQ